MRMASKPFQRSNPCEFIHMEWHVIDWSRLPSGLAVPAVVVNELEEAEVLVTLRSYYRNRQRPVIDAENRGMPIYVLRANTVNQMQHFLSDLYNLSTSVSEDQRLGSCHAKHSGSH